MIYICILFFFIILLLSLFTVITSKNFCMYTNKYLKNRLTFGFKTIYRKSCYTTHK